jgi:hypothetical protein
MTNVFLKLLGHAVVVLLLTAVTQTGGLCYLLAIIITRNLMEPSLGRALAMAMTFMVFYSLAWAASTQIAPMFGRVALPCMVTETSNLTVSSPIRCALNRHYVTPEVAAVATKLADHMAEQFPNTQTIVLDANFPFFNGFPLLPHLSHQDGRKIDISFYYQNTAGEYVRGKTPSPTGYWAFTEPTVAEQAVCRGQAEWSSLRWNMTWFQLLIDHDLHLDPRRTRAAITWLVNEGHQQGVQKIFLEPHLKSRLGITSERVRFQGCHAARHDDHIHVQL